MPRTTIIGLKVRQILDGEGQKTLEIDVMTEGGMGRAAPSFAHQRTQGPYEVVHFPEGGIEESVRLIREVIGPKIIGMDATQQEAVDKVLKELDGTPNLASLGGNTIEGVSTAVAHAAANTLGVPLCFYMGGPFCTEVPNPMVNIIGGGPTAGGDDWRGRTPDFQEHDVIIAGAKNIYEAGVTAVEVHYEAGAVLAKRVPAFSGGKDLEYSWLPNITDREALDVLREAAERVEERRGIRIVLCIDVAATDMWIPEKNVYYYQREGVYRTKEEQLDYIRKLIEDYNLYYIEDPFFEDHFCSYTELTRDFGDRCLIIGDDLFGGQMKRLEEGIHQAAGNCTMLKVNMIGTLTDAYYYNMKAKNNGFAVIVSPRCGDTADTTPAHLGLAWHSNLIKTVGAIGGERVAKINEFVRIVEEYTHGEVKMAPLPGLNEEK